MEEDIMNKIEIRPDIPQYMAQLRRWLAENENTPLEEMDQFFASRADIYEAHMAQWQPAYAFLAGLVPKSAETLLDLGCGTGLELTGILRRLPELRITGIDLSQTMLNRLRKKFPDQHIELICADYFQAALGENRFDAAISFESLHHFKPKKKQTLFDKLYTALKPGGVYIHGDYLACCPEEEALLFSVCAEKRARAGIAEDTFVHFDTPLTLGHEIGLLRNSGFRNIRFVRCIAGASILTMEK